MTTETFGISAKTTGSTTTTVSTAMVASTILAEALATAEAWDTAGARGTAVKVQVGRAYVRADCGNSRPQPAEPLDALNKIYATLAWLDSSARN